MSMRATLMTGARGLDRGIPVYVQGMMAPELRQGRGSGNLIPPASLRPGIGIGRHYSRFGP